MSGPPKASGSGAKYSGVSASSFLDLKAELSKHESDFKKSKNLGLPSTTLGAKRPGAKPSIWTKKNKGVAGREERDRVQFEDDPRSNRDPAQVKAMLERKALLYDKIKKGKTGGLNEGQIDNLLVDFDRKRWDAPTDSEESDEDESASVPQRPAADEASRAKASAAAFSQSSLKVDPMVEWTDEFGRTRMLRRSEVPRGTAVATEEAPDDTNVIYGDQFSFPVYTADADVLAARAAAFAASAPLVSHYDASAENRSKAAGAYSFSKDEDTRREQMAALTREREETERLRRKEAEGGGVFGEREREKEERKRKVEAKRRELEMKRKRAAGVEDEGGSASKAAKT